MYPDRLLANVLRDLRGGLDEPEDEYQLLRTSGLLRLMLLDRDPLLVSVARAYGYSLTFEVNGHQPIAVRASGAGGAVAAYPGLSPREGGSVRRFTREEFLGHPVIHASADGVTTTFSVKVVIRVAAIAFGGVHFMDPDRPEDRELSQLARSFDPSSGHHVAMALLGVGHVALAASADLLERLESFGH